MFPLTVRIAPKVLPALLVIAAGGRARAQGDDGPIDIGEVGSSRIGGPGLSDDERRRNAYDDEEEELPTEDNIPPLDNPKRLPHLHILAKRYVSGNLWKEACARYEQILSESGDDGVASTPDGKTLAARSFYECGEQAAVIGHFENAETYLKKSERLGPSDYRHAGVRRRIKRDMYRAKMTNQDVDGAMGIFDQYQAEKQDEDERIWMGEQVTELAWTAYRAKDKVALDRYIGYAKKVAPKNPNLRRLTDKIHTEETVLTNVLIMGVAAVAVVLLLGQLWRWSAKRRVERLAGGLAGGRKNKFLDDEA